MTKKAITALYRRWRKENGNRKPDRAIVRMYWLPASPDPLLTDTISLKDCDILPNDDNCILFYANGLRGLLSLTDPDNGGDFVVVDVLEFYHS